MNKRVFGMLIVEVENANPNGEVDSGGGPRILEDGRGWFTDVCIKAKIRRLMENHDSPVASHVIESLQLNPDRYHILESELRGFDVKSESEAVAKLKVMFNEEGESAVCERFFDPRTFGYTALFSDKKSKKKPKKKTKNGDTENEGEGENGEAGKVQFKRTGCCSFSLGVSICPVEVEYGTISKSHPLDGNDNMLAPEGKKFVRHGLYYMSFTIDPFAAKATGTTDEDIEVLKALLPRLFDHSMSCSRPSNSVRLVHAWWREHNASIKTFNEYEFRKSLMPVRLGDNPDQSSKSIADYHIPNGEEFGAVDLLKNMYDISIPLVEEK